MEYISYIQTENLFKVWQTLKAIGENVTRELTIMGFGGRKENPEDYIYTKSIGNKALSDMPHSGKLSDTTGDIAIKYKQIMKRDFKDTVELLKQEKFYIDLVDDKLSIAFRMLSPLNQELLKLFYWEKKTWSEVIEALKEYEEFKKEERFISKHQAQDKRRESIEEMQRVSRITVEMYEYVIKLVEVER